MRRLLLLLLLFATPAAAAEPEVIAAEAWYPEGLFWDQETETLYFAEMTGERVRRWQDGALTTFVETKSCGPTAIARAGALFVVACHRGGHLLVVDAEGQVVERLFESTDGRRLVDPNDLGGDGEGVYVSDSGSFSPTAPPTGALLYWRPDLGLRLLATGLQYANGVLVDTEGQRLLVSEHLARRILAFPILKPGDIDLPSVFADIAALIDLKDPHAGPDGLDLGPDRQVYAAIYGAGRVLAFDAGGAPLGQFTLPPAFSTSVAVAPDGIFACGAYDNMLAPFLGPVLRFSPDALEPASR
jgi:sugar lactone lactonase YvrE